MEIVENIFLVLHFIGLASLLGGALVQMSAIKTGTAKIVPAIMHGAWTMLVTGIILFGLALFGGEDEDEPLNHTKFTVKFAVLLAIIVIALVNKKKDVIAGWVLPTIAGLAVLNVILAVFWQ